MVTITEIRSDPYWALGTADRPVDANEIRDAIHGQGYMMMSVQTTNVPPFEWWSMITELPAFSARQRTLFEFVKQKHGPQVRKYTGEPYWYHLVEVAKMVWDHEHYAVEAALCHDLIEDTTCGYRHLKQELIRIGYIEDAATCIRNTVEELTDHFPGGALDDNGRELSRTNRKQREAQRLRLVSRTAQTIKFADLIHNAQSIIEHDKAFAPVFIQEATDLAREMRLGDEKLFLRLCNIIHNYHERKN